MIRRCRPSLYGHNLLISKGYLCSIKETKHDDNKIPKLKIKKHGESKSQEHHVDFATSGPGLKAMNVTKIGALANLGLAISKGTIGFSIASTGLIADAANSLGDLLSDAVVYYSVTEARKRATPDRPWGRGKIEPLGKPYFHNQVAILYYIINRCIIGWRTASSYWIRNWIFCSIGSHRCCISITNDTTRIF